MPPQQESKRQRVYKIIVALAGVLFVVYVAKGVLLFAFQRKFLYVPPGRASVVPDKDIQTVQTKTADGLTLTAWFAPPKGQKPVVVSFHGNGDDLNSAALILPSFRSHGFGVFLCESRDAEAKWRRRNVRRHGQDSRRSFTNRLVRSAEKARRKNYRLVSRRRRSHRLQWFQGAPAA
jgi:hypothetical protein